MHLSEAYAVLSHVDKRARYDSDVMRRLHPHYHHGPKPSGSYHSTGPAGGRPASGLSRRRGTYQGPPPSFYRSGGWGAHGAKRRAAHEESTGTGAGFRTHSHPHSHANPGGPNPGAPPPPPPPPPPPGSGGGHGAYRPGTGSGMGGMGPGQDPFHRGDDVPHFDHAAHERVQRRGDDRRAHRMAQKMGVNIDQPESQTTMSFFAVAAILAVVVMGPFVISGVSGGGAKGNGNGNGNSGKGEKEKEAGRKGK